MEIALIVSITVAIVFAALFFDERGIIKKYFEDSAAVEPARAVPTPSVDDLDLRELNPDLVAEAIKYNGYVPEMGEDCVSFMVQGERCIVTTDRLPFLTVIRHYSLDPEDCDNELLRDAASKATCGLLMGKCWISDDNKVLTFSTTGIEPKYGHFRDALVKYLGVLSDVERLLGETYNKLMDDKRDLEKLEANGIEIPQPSGREGKIVS